MAPLIGRARERTQLDAALERIGHGGRVVVRAGGQRAADGKLDVLGSALGRA